MRSKGGVLVGSASSRKVEAVLVAALTALVAAALIVVEMTPQGSDRFVWSMGALLLAAGGATWRFQHWPARPWVVFVMSVIVVVVGYGIWLWWYIAAHPPQAA